MHTSQWTETIINQITGEVLYSLDITRMEHTGGYTASIRNNGCVVPAGEWTCREDMIHGISEEFRYLAGITK